MVQMTLHCYMSAYNQSELPMLFKLMSFAHLKVYSNFQLHFLASTKLCTPESFETSIWPWAGLIRKPALGTRSSLGLAGTGDFFSFFNNSSLNTRRDTAYFPSIILTLILFLYTVTSCWAFPYLTGTPGTRQCEDATIVRMCSGEPIFAFREYWACKEPCPVKRGRGGGRPGIWKFHTTSFHTIHSIAAFNRLARPHRRSHHHGSRA